MRCLRLGVYTVFILTSLYAVQALDVDVYYEALCGDSVSFITRQLYPQFAELNDYINLDLVPYGKAMHSNRSGKWQFKCQHGPQECKGNKFQACSFSQLPNQHDRVRFVNCVMRERNPSSIDTIKKCTQIFKLKFESIRSCALSEEGDNLMAANGDKTWNLEPSLSFVPTIVYDQEYNQLSQDQSLEDFVAVVCSKINGTKPTICNNRKLPSSRSYFFM